MCGNIWTVCIELKGCTNPRHQVTWETKFCTVIPYVCAFCHSSGAWNLEVALRFLENLCILVILNTYLYDLKCMLKFGFHCTRHFISPSFCKHKKQGSFEVFLESLYFREIQNSTIICATFPSK